MILVDWNDDDDDQLWELDYENIMPKEDDHIIFHAMAEEGKHFCLINCKKMKKQ